MSIKIIDEPAKFIEKSSPYYPLVTAKCHTEAEVNAKILAIFKRVTQEEYAPLSPLLGKLISRVTQLKLDLSSWPPRIKNKIIQIEHLLVCFKKIKEANAKLTKSIQSLFEENDSTSRPNLPKLKDDIISQTASIALEFSDYVPYDFIITQAQGIIKEYTNGKPFQPIAREKFVAAYLFKTCCSLVESSKSPQDPNSQLHILQRIVAIMSSPLSENIIEEVWFMWASLYKDKFNCTTTNKELETAFPSFINFSELFFKPNILTPKSHHKVYSVIKHTWNLLKTRLVENIKGSINGIQLEEHQQSLMFLLKVFCYLKSAVYPKEINVIYGETKAQINEMISTNISQLEATSTLEIFTPLTKDLLLTIYSIDSCNKNQAASIEEIISNFETVNERLRLHSRAILDGKHSILIEVLLDITRTMVSTCFRNKKAMLERNKIMVTDSPEKRIDKRLEPVFNALRVLLGVDISIVVKMEVDYDPLIALITQSLDTMTSDEVASMSQIKAWINENRSKKDLSNFSLWLKDFVKHKLSFDPIRDCESLYTLYQSQQPPKAL